MTEPIAQKIGVANLGTVYNQTNHITIHEGQQLALIYSDPVPDLRFFQGRTAELSNFTSWLADRSIAMIGVGGEGGIGKSTLAAKAFAESPGFAGKFWVDVRTGTSITALAARALQEFGVSPEHVRAIEEKDLLPRLLRQLQQGRYLLAIDNLESVLTATGEWQSGYDLLLDGVQEFGGESVLLLASREFPPQYFSWRQSRWLMVKDGLEPAEGAALLEALEVVDTAENRAALSVQMEGSPLALSLVASWLRDTYRPGERFVEHLRQHTDLFQVEGKHRGEARVSVNRVLQWSLDRLTPAQQNLLTQVSVLRGAFSYLAAAALVLEQPVSDANLEDLERRFLVQILPNRDQDGLKQFRLQPRIQDFVKRRTPDLTTAHERAITHFWSHRQTKFTPEDTLDAVNPYEETFYHQSQLGHYQDAAVTLFDCTNFLYRRGYYQTLVALYHQLHTDWHPTPAQRQDYALVCNNLGVAYQSLGQYQQAIDIHQQSLAMRREIGNRNGEADSLCNLGTTYQLLGQYEQAIGFFEQSLEIKREISACYSEANSLNGLGNAYKALGQYQRAIDFYEQSLAITREINDLNNAATSLIGLGIAYRSLGQYQRAIDFCELSLTITRDIGDRHGEGASLCNLGNAYFFLGRSQQAINFYEQSLAIARDIGDRNGEANTLCNLGAAYKALGQYQQAIGFCGQSLAIQCEIGNRHGEAASLTVLGAAYLHLDQYQQAIDVYGRSLTIQCEIGDRNGKASSLIGMGNAYHFLGQYQQAIDFYEQSLTINGSDRISSR